MCRVSAMARTKKSEQNVLQHGLDILQTTLGHASSNAIRILPKPSVQGDFDLKLGLCPDCTWTLLNGTPFVAGFLMFAAKEAAVWKHSFLGVAASGILVRGDTCGLADQLPGPLPKTAYQARSGKLVHSVWP